MESALTSHTHWPGPSFRSSLVPMVIADDDRRYVAVNPAACLLLRLPAAKVLGMRIDDLTPDGQDADMDALWRAFRSEGTQRGTFELQMPDGPQLTVEYSATADVRPGRHLSILMFPPSGAEGDGDRDRPVQLLSEREREVLGMVAMGMGSVWIAGNLGVSVSTVETHVRHCLAKLGARNRAHAIALGIAGGEITLDFGDVDF